MKDEKYSTVNKLLMDLKSIGVDIEKAPIRIFLSEEDFIEIVKYKSGWGMVDSRTYIDEEGFPHVKPIGLRSLSIYIVCPYCKAIHHHGRVDKEKIDNFGHRSSHCWGDNISCLKDKGYLID